MCDSKTGIIEEVVEETDVETQEVTAEDVGDLDEVLEGAKSETEKEDEEVEQATTEPSVEVVEVDALDLTFGVPVEMANEAMGLVNISKPTKQISYAIAGTLTLVATVEEDGIYVYQPVKLKEGETPEDKQCYSRIKVFDRPVNMLKLFIREKGMLAIVATIDDDGLIYIELGEKTYLHSIKGLANVLDVALSVNDPRNILVHKKSDADDDHVILSVAIETADVHPTVITIPIDSLVEFYTLGIIGFVESMEMTACLRTITKDDEEIDSLVIIKDDMTITNLKISEKVPALLDYFKTLKG